MKFPEFESKYSKLFFDDRKRRVIRSDYWECGPGWFKIIDRLMGDIYQYSDKIKVFCIKEKLGGLRIYLTYDNPNLSWLGKVWNEITVWMYRNGHGVFWNKINNTRKRLWKTEFEKVNELVRQAELLSLETCECCGHLGKRLSLGGWLKTLCSTCQERYEKNPVLFRDEMYKEN